MKKQGNGYQTEVQPYGEMVDDLRATGLVISGGAGNKPCYVAGFLAAMKEHGYQPDKIHATSGGIPVGAAYIQGDMSVILDIYEGMNGSDSLFAGEQREQPSVGKMAGFFFKVAWDRHVRQRLGLASDPDGSIKELGDQMGLTPHYMTQQISEKLDEKTLRESDIEMTMHMTQLYDGATKSLTGWQAEQRNPKELYQKSVYC